MDSYQGTLLTVSRSGQRHNVLPSPSMLDHRAIRSTQWVRKLWIEDPDLNVQLRDGLLYLQFDDYRHNALPSIAYGRAIGSDPIVELVPDTYFFESEGYAATRRAAAAGALPPWSQRRSSVFWRGTATHDGRSPDGQPTNEPSDIPRLAMCLALRDTAHADVGIKPWHAGDPAPPLVGQVIDAERLRKPMVPMIEHAGYKLQIDIDGVANAWSLFEKLLMGSCILKVASPYEQWFYGELEPWVHFVPVRADLSDLHKRLDWCLSHDLEAEQIGRRAQAFASVHTFDHALTIGREALQRSFIDFGGETRKVVRSSSSQTRRRMELLFPAGPDLLILDFGDERSASFMREGWGGHEKTWMWATGTASTINLGHADFEYDGVLFLEVQPAFNAAVMPSQRLQLVVNHVVVADFVTEGPLPRTFKCVVPYGVLRAEELIVELRHPDWLRPADIYEDSHDVRQLSFLCRELRIQQLTPAFNHVLDRLRAGMIRPITSSTDPAFASDTRDARELVGRFESLGLNCEFGFVQRENGLETLSLLRFNGLPWRKLMKGLRDDFGQIAHPGSLRLEVMAGHEDQGYMGFERNYEMVYHTDRKPEDVQHDLLMASEAKRLPYLARKLIEDVEEGGKLLVIKSDGGLHLEEVASLLALLERKGDSMLLWVLEADAAHVVGRVDLIDDRLMTGYIGHFASLNQGLGTIAFDHWDLMLRNASAIASSVGRP